MTDMGAVSGLFYGGGFGQLGIQVLGTLVISAWSFSTMIVLFYVMRATIGIRVSEKEELEGLDISEHGTISYPEFGRPAFGAPGERTLMPHSGD
jgi:Amt family ammonium transporter